MLGVHIWRMSIVLRQVLTPYEGTVGLSPHVLPRMCRQCVSTFKS